LKGFCDSVPSPLLAMEAVMAGKEISVKKYVVRLSSEERKQLETLIRLARRLLKARILLKADVSEAGPGWSDSKIIAALDTSASMIYRVRKQLVEEGFEAVLTWTHRIQGRGAIDSRPESGLPSDRHPGRTKRAVVLEAVKVWPGKGGVRRKVGASANLDSSCARRLCNIAGRGEETELRVEQRNRSRQCAPL
jgi:hypothetical protein